MSYQKLLSQFENHPISIKRTDIIGAVNEYIDRPVKLFVSGLDTELLRGYYLSSEEAANSRWRNFSGGGPVVVVARGLNRCWSRLVIIKELMHVFDEENQKTSTADNFEIVLNELSSGVPTDDMAIQTRREHSSVTMALRILCPIAHISQMKEDFQKGQITPYDIALQFRIPEQYVSVILNESFLHNVY